MISSGESSSEDTTSGSEYIPTDCEEEDTAIIHEETEEDIDPETPGPSKGKKRVKNPEKWKRNMKKKKLFSEKNIRREIGICRCRCKEKLCIADQTFIFNRYCSLSSHSEQTIYLQGCINKTENARSRPRKENPKKRSTFQYAVVTENGRSILLCQKAFLAVHGIFKSRLEKKVKTGSQPKDNRGCHSIRPNRTPKQSLEAVRKFILDLPARESHYTRSDSRNRKYLDPNLSITKLHEDFSHQNPNNKVSYGIFSKVFNEEFNISFGYPRKDICNTCTKLIVDITQAEMESKTDILRKLKSDKELHLKRAEVFKTAVTDAQIESTDISEMIICFDFEKNLPLPVTNAQDEYYISQLWLNVFGIHNRRTHKATMYVYTENFALKGPNEVISCLSDYINHHKDPQQKNLKIFCDNAFSQNKNRYLFMFLDQLCKTNIFHRIEVIYPVPGHSMMPIDRDFAAIEKKRLKLEKVDNPEAYIELIKSCRKKNPFEVVFVQHSLRSNGQLLPGDRVIKVENYKKWIEPYTKSSVAGISKTRRVLFEIGKKVHASDTMTGFTSEMSLYKVGMNRKISNSPALAYGDTYLKIKDQKFNSVQKLLKFVSGDTEFYRRTLLNPALVATPTRKDTGIDENVDSDVDVYE